MRRSDSLNWERSWGEKGPGTGRQLSDNQRKNCEPTVKLCVLDTIACATKLQQKSTGASIRDLRLRDPTLNVSENKSMGPSGYTNTWKAEHNFLDPSTLMSSPFPFSDLRALGPKANFVGAQQAKLMRGSYSDRSACQYLQFRFPVRDGIWCSNLSRNTETFHWRPVRHILSKLGSWK